ncbi:FtsK/SpoIIIE domain-containing protein [Nonomuraea sp. NPDC050310]|uniref:FtsK/SpoIIIE domain-containing protein n=1 Tax=Nonomuraea sp. NPDC050310 TaxID=3154935 RepID=UPI0033BFE634
MRIMLTVLDERGDRDVVVEGEGELTVGRLADALRGQDVPLAKVVRLNRAPYGLSPTSSWDTDPLLSAPGHPATLWRNGRELDPRAPVRAILRDGDRVALSEHLARHTITDEPGGVAEIRVVGGPGAGLVHRLGLGQHVIGSSDLCAIAVPDPSLPPEAALLRITPETITIEPVRHAQPLTGGPRRKLKGRYADDVAQLLGRAESRSAAAVPEPADLQLESDPVTEAVDWPEHALLTCGSTVLALTAIEAPDAHLAPRPEGGVAYNRPPRLRRPEPERRFERPAEPRRTEGLRLQLLAALLPALLGVGLAYFLGQWYFLLIALMSPLIMFGQWWSDRRHGRKKHRRAMKDYQERLAEYEHEVADARRQDELARRSDAPDAAELLLTATGPRRRLWERRIHDPDALRLRVGLADLPANLELAEERGGPLDPPLCHAVPVALPLRRLGVAGVTGPRETTSGLVSWLIGQAATLHSPRDLAIVVLSAHSDGEARWSWVRWLPHCSGQGVLPADSVTLVGADPETAARRVAELSSLIDERLNTSIPELGKIPTGWDDLGGPATPTEPAFATYDERPFDVLVVLDGAQVLRGLPGMPQVLRQGPRAGVYTLAVDDDQRLLPEECATVATCDDTGLVRLRGGGLDALGPLLADQVSPSWCDRLARALAPIRDVSRADLAGQLPGSARLLDLLSLPAPTASDIATRWTDRGTTAAPIGIGPDGPFAVDLAVDGPHGLIAGTTGAGKSELLQTLICSLATANRPDQLTFVLIDYKGGAAFNDCVRLPHTVGMVTDLDGHLTQRALDSLAAEIRRRERLLLRVGAKDIEDYSHHLHTLTRPAPHWSGGDGPARPTPGHPGFAPANPGDPARSTAGNLSNSGTGGTWSFGPRETASSGFRPTLDTGADGSPTPGAGGISGSGGGYPSGSGSSGPLGSGSRGTLGSGPAGWLARLRAVEQSRLDGPWLTGSTAPHGPAAPATRPHNSALPSWAAADPAPTESHPYGGGPHPNARQPHASQAPGSQAPGTQTREPHAEAPPEVLPTKKGPSEQELDPLPRLVLIIDEFAALVAELPDFVSGLVDIARRGRSLGIHLILATQRPAGVVTADIQANTSLRIALRVTEPAESADVIDVPDAAHISRSTPGRCYVRAGVGAATAVQTARIGGRGGGTRSSAPVRVTDLTWRSLGRALPAPQDPDDGSGTTDLALLVDAIAEAARLAQVPEQPSPWLDPLPEQVVIATPERHADPTIPEAHRPSATAAEVAPVEFGVTDLPWAQQQRPLTLDLDKGGHLLIAGSARTGRSTALRTIAGRIAATASPADVHVHAIDCGSGALLPLVAMPHCGAVVTRDQLDRVERLLIRLRAEVGRRQQLLAEAGHSSLAEYRAAGNRLPWLVLLIDRWEGYAAAFEGYDYGRLTEALLQLLREGAAVGLRAVVTGDRSALIGQVSTVFDDRLILRLADSADYGLAGLPIKELPSTMPPGRAVSMGDHGLIESQIALLDPDPSGPAQVAAFQKLARLARAAQSDERAPGERAIRSERVPSQAGVRRDLLSEIGAGGGGVPSQAGASGDVLSEAGAGSGVSAGSGSIPSQGAPSRSGDGGGGNGNGNGNGNEIIPTQRAISGGGGLREGGVGSAGWIWDGEPPLRVDSMPNRITASQAMALVPGFAPPSPLWALVGVGGDSLAPMGIDLLAQGPGAVVAGPPRSGRSSVLLTAARSLIDQGTPVIAVVPRRSPLRELEGALAVLDGNGTGLQDLIADRERYVVIVDDAELINPDAPLGLVLDEVLRSGRDGEHGLIIGGATGDLTTAYRGFVAEARKPRTGVLLSVQSPADGDLFNVRLPRGAVGGPPGRGLLIGMGVVTPVQTALPDRGGA